MIAQWAHGTGLPVPDFVWALFQGSAFTLAGLANLHHSLSISILLPLTFLSLAWDQHHSLKALSASSLPPSSFKCHLKKTFCPPSFVSVSAFQINCTDTICQSSNILTKMAKLHFYFPIVETNYNLSVYTSTKISMKMYSIVPKCYSSYFFFQYFNV